MTEIKKEVIDGCEVDIKVKAAKAALNEFLNFTQEKIDYIVAKASVAGLDAHGSLAELAVNETKRGVFEDKATKNLFACEHVVNNMRHLKTVGIISDDPVTGITEIAEPVGIVAGLTPVTNPTSTAIFKALICLKTRNPIIFAFHPNAQKCSVAAAKVIRDAAVAAGAPKDCIQWIDVPSMEATSALMNHPDVATILATGGNAMVKAAYSCGKPALGVGAGNVPAYIVKDCNLAQAVNDVVLSKSFDNGMICASEQNCIIDKEVFDEAIDLFKRYKTYFANDKEKQMLEQYLFGVTAKDKNYEEAHLNPNVVGKSCYEIASNAGFKVPEDTQVIGVLVKTIGIKEPLTREKLSPVLSFLKVDSLEEGIKMSASSVAFNGLGHSASIHTSNKEIANKFGEAVKAIRVIWNSPSTFGGIGNVYNSFLPSLTLGCGSYGHNSVDGNVSAVDLINIKTLGKRRNNMQWFKVPQKIYFERNSIEYLKSAKDVNKVFIVSDKTMVELGYLNKIIEQLRLRRNMVSIQLFTDVEPDPDIETIEKGRLLMSSFNPDTIIALGGGSVMDAAKGMWLFYEHPEVDFDDLKQKFMDIRKRAFKYPELGRKSHLICIPTTSGTGSEVTPFAVISDKKNNKKYPLADYSLTPTIAIVDAEFTTNLPSFVTATTGMDVLTHAVEAYTSVLANDYTDGLALNSIKIVFEYLERATIDGKNDLEAREKMHNASCMAGMAFANAFLGMNHSMAHKVGGLFHVPHGLANAILLPYTIRYNGTTPSHLSLWPKYNSYVADKKFFEIACAIGLKPNSVEEGVEMFAQACYDLGVKLGLKLNFKDNAHGAYDEETWMNSCHQLAMLAFEDQCTPANPRIPFVKDIEDILKRAYNG